jgi:RNA polymerase sigma factor (TIGR02999 family)
MDHESCPFIPSPAPESDLGVDEHFTRGYHVLRRMAHARLRDSGGDLMLNTTALVHESWLKLSNSSLGFPDRARFLSYAGRAMRSIIVDLVRQRRAERHGAQATHLTLTSGGADAIAASQGAEDVLRVHEALEELARLDLRMAQVVEMKYFAGMTEAEIAEALGVTDRTVRRDWEQARLMLSAALG